MIIKRELFAPLKTHLNKKEMSLVVGPRQAGKTTLLKILKKDLEEKNKKTLYLSLDIERDRQFFLTQNSLIEKIKLEFGENKGYVFLDEIQRKENAGLFLKGIYDLELGHKIIASGSGSVELKEKIHESLAGRKRIFRLNTLSFNEFVNFKTNYKYQNKLGVFLKTDKIKRNSFLKEYLNFGGYPRVVLEKEAGEKEAIIDEIYRSWMERDISALGVEKQQEFSDLVKIIGSQAGQLVNYNELSSTLDLSLQIVKKYLYFAQKTFILNKVAPFFKNKRKEITKSPIFYFTDLGLKNFSNGVFGKASALKNIGFLFQNFIFIMLLNRNNFSNEKIKFWRSKHGAEVDFIIDLGTKRLPIEVKYKALSEAKISRGFRSFLKRYEPDKALVVNLNLEKIVKIEGCKVHFVPFYKLITDKQTLTID